MASEARPILRKREPGLITIVSSPDLGGMEDSLEWLHEKEGENVDEVAFAAKETAGT